MAFPIPSHLPRKSTTGDVSSKILSRMDEATYGSLTASLATSWLVELDETILSTKERLHERIQSDLPSFELQLSSAKSIQTRLQSLTENVQVLDEAISDPNTGLIPTLVRALSRHAALSQECSDAVLAHEVYSHLLRCKAEFSTLSSLVQAGRLPEAAGICRHLKLKLDNAPLPLNESKILTDLKQQFRVTKDYIEEQLNDAYARSFTMTQTEITIRSPVQVRKSENMMSLNAILLTLSPSSVSSHLTTFRRDLITHYIDRILKQSTSVSTASSIHILDMQEHKLTLFPSPPNSEIRSARLENLALILKFLDTHLFPFLPEPQKESLSGLLYKPIATGILNHLLIPSLPSSFSALPTFLDLVRMAVGFEEEHIESVFRGAAAERTIKSWADGVGGHYERKRRVDLLEKARVIITHADDEHATFSVEVESHLQSRSEGKKAVLPPPAEDDAVNNEAWGFDDADATVLDETGWGLDDVVDNNGGLGDLQDNIEPSSKTGQDKNLPIEDDPAASWGWNDDEVSSTADENNDEVTWDDPWNDEPPESNTPSAPPASSSQKEGPTSGQSTVKNAGTQLNGKSHGPVPSTGTSQTSAPKESYLVSTYVKQLINVVEDVLEEGKEFALSRIVALPSSSSSNPGSLILQSAISVLDLFRALYPVKFGSVLASPEGAMRFSNDCIYLSNEVEKIVERVHSFQDVSQKLMECKDSLQVLGDSWFDDTIERHRQTVDEILLACHGFTGTTEQDRYDECESAISRVLQHVRLLARRWKGVLIQRKYYAALGLVVDAALSRILEDVLALPDITADESHKLSELCRIFNSLEGLFFVNISEPSPVAAYVPSWLKFSYLSELLEASIADISYLFEIGALVDFEVGELVSLVRALFADTPLRANTINKFLAK